jgi:hypothetical protein
MPTLNAAYFTLALDYRWWAVVVKSTILRFSHQENPVLWQGKWYFIEGGLPQELRVIGRRVSSSLCRAV